MTKLKELNLQENNLKTIPEAISSLGSSLSILNLGGNPIENIGKNSFLGLNLLKQLNISGMNELKSIEIGSFSSLQKLEVLMCRNNPLLVNFDGEGLKNARNLKEVSVLCLKK